MNKGGGKMRFEFATATQIIFGQGTAQEIAPHASQLGKRACVITGKDTRRSAFLFEQLAQHQVKTIQFSVSGEPTIEVALEGLQKARDAECDVVIGFGGGSVLDTGKVVAALLTNPGNLMDYLEVIGQGKPLKHPSAPYIAVTTTAGTGAEVTRNSVLGSLKHQVKVSMRSPLMLPRLAIVDPELTQTMPPSITASTGLDALTQVIEPYVSNKANPLTDSICREGMQRAARSLQKAYENGNDLAAREDMSLTNLFGGLALANAKLGAVHGFAGPIGGMFPASHGVICARFLPYVMESNVKALQTRDPQSEYLKRYTEVAQILTGNSSASATDGVAWIQQLCEALKVPALTDYGLTRAMFPEVIEKSKKASSMKGNPILLTDQELEMILQQAINA